MYKCSLSDEILQMYSTVLKGISMKAKDLDDFSVLFSDGTCPLFIYANPHIYNADSVVLSGARMVILNLCLIKNPIIQDLICGAKSGIRTLISSLDTDEFLFLADLMNVVPLSLLNYIIKHLRAELSSTNLHTLAKAISYLEQSPARSMLMELVSSKLPIMLEIKSDLPMALSLTLFCLKNKLILLDPAIEFGMIDSYGNSSRKPKSKKGFNFKETVIQIFTKQISVETVALTLKIIEFLYGSEIPDVYIVNNTIIGELKKMSPNVLLPIFLKQIKPQRCDMTYYISQKADLPKYSNEQKKIFILYEIQKYLTQGNFQGFILDSSTCTEKQGPVKDINNRIIVLNEGELIFSDEKYKISDFYVCDKKETSKTSNKVFFKSKSNSFNENFFEFPSTEIAKLFKQNLENMQRIVISNMLDKLVMKPERY
ncbi:hypothetical protein GPJ56_007117 [Histomonas meleagridis]|uniref:uncharacterized protein n=1 Tax=Histomonas meleagridis TaxID=135588 RepID=UPI00355A5457|nr:hypothetical protein GPJ56_007117 [Histomonas meleagridis]KAH0796088.1 hypothetical protein GO595_011055 [Histomonas meleagridis]